MGNGQRLLNSSYETIRLSGQNEIKNMIVNSNAL